MTCVRAPILILAVATFGTVINTQDFIDKPPDDFVIQDAVLNLLQRVQKLEEKNQLLEVKNRNLEQTIKNI